MKGPARPDAAWLRAWWPALAWAGVIWWASSLVVTPDMYPTVRGGDKLFHAGEFLVYGYLMARGAWLRRWSTTRSEWHRIMAVVLITAVIDEWHQAFVPFRHADALDAAVDLLGGALGALGFARDHRA